MARVPVKSMSDMPMASRTKARTGPGPPLERRRHLVAEVHGVGVPDRRGEEGDEDAGHLFGARVQRRALPARGPRDAPEHVQLRPGAEADAVEDGQADGDADALLHPDQHDGEERHRRQPELEEIEAGDGREVAPVEEPEGDEDEDARPASPAARP